jgi:hypothetical protein
LRALAQLSLFNSLKPKIPNFSNYAENSAFFNLENVSLMAQNMRQRYDEQVGKIFTGVIQGFVTPLYSEIAHHRNALIFIEFIPRPQCSLD